MRLLRRTRPSPKSKKVCQSMNRRGARWPPRRSAGSGPAGCVGVEHEPEELLRHIGRAGSEVSAVARPDLRVTEPVGRDRELHRDERVVAPVGAVPALVRHTGEVALRGPDIVGLAVHIAARVMGCAGLGDVVMTRTVTESCLTRIRPDLAFP